MAINTYNESWGVLQDSRSTNHNVYGCSASKLEDPKKKRSGQGNEVRTTHFNEKKWMDGRAEKSGTVNVGGKKENRCILWTVCGFILANNGRTNCGSSNAKEIGDPKFIVLEKSRDHKTTKYILRVLMGMQVHCMAVQCNPGPFQLKPSLNISNLSTHVTQQICPNVLQQA